MNWKAWRRRRNAWLLRLVGFGGWCLGIGLVAHPPAFDSIGLKFEQTATGGEIDVGKADEARIERIEKSGVMAEILDPNGARKQLAVKFGAALGFVMFEPDVAERKMESIIAQTFPDVCGLSRLYELDMGGCKPFRDTHLAALPATWGLRRINLSSTGVTDKGIPELSRHLDLDSVFSQSDGSH